MNLLNHCITNWFYLTDEFLLLLLLPRVKVDGKSVDRENKAACNGEIKKNMQKSKQFHQRDNIFEAYHISGLSKTN